MAVVAGVTVAVVHVVGVVAVSDGFVAAALAAVAVLISVFLVMLPGKVVRRPIVHAT